MSYVKKLLAVGAFAAVAAVATQSYAATYLLGVSENFGNGDFGSVSVTQDGANMLKYVVTLADGYNFTDNGQGHVDFSFSLTGNPTLGVSTASPKPASYVTLPSGFTFTDSTNGVKNSPFNGFDYGLDCPKAVCGPNNNGYTGGTTPSTLTFYVTSPGITDAWVDFASDPYNGKNVFFAADVIKVKNCSSKCTGAVGSIAQAVPEPATWALMGLGVFSIGLALRLNRKGALRPVSA